MGSSPFKLRMALQNVCFVSNHGVSTTLKNNIPLEVLTHVAPDISSLLRYLWWAPVYYLN